MCLFSSCITIDHTIAKDWYSVFCSIFRGTIICSVFTLLTCPKIARAREQTKKAAQHYFLLRRTYDSKNEPNIESKMHFFAPNSLATSFATQQQWGFQIQGEKCWETSWETRWPQAGRQIGSKVRDKVGDTVGDKGAKCSRSWETGRSQRHSGRHGGPSLNGPTQTNIPQICLTILLRHIQNMSRYCNYWEAQE